MIHDPKALFQEVWETLARRIAGGKNRRDEIRFFLTDGRVQRFDIPEMGDDQMKNNFLEITFNAMNALPVEAVLLYFEVWYVEAPVSKEGLQEYLDNNPRPSKSPDKREGISFYYETVGGVMVSSFAEILTGEKGKKSLGALRNFSVAELETRMSHLFKKAREHQIRSHNITESILRRN